MFGGEEQQQRPMMQSRPIYNEPAPQMSQIVQQPQRENQFARMLLEKRLRAQQMNNGLLG
jgi:hypothetical protein